MKRFLLLGAIALMFTSVSCSNDESQEETQAMNLHELSASARPVLNDLYKMQQTPYAELPQDGQDTVDEIVEGLTLGRPMPRVICAFIGNDGITYFVGSYNGGYYVVEPNMGQPASSGCWQVPKSMASGLCL